MRTEIIVMRGALRGRAGWISGDLEDRARRGITKAIVHVGCEVELLETANLQANDQLVLFPAAETKTPPAMASGAQSIGDLKFSASGSGRRQRRRR